MHGFHQSAVSELRCLFDSFFTRVYFNILHDKGELRSYWKNENDEFIDWVEKDGLNFIKKVDSNTELVKFSEPPCKGGRITNAYSQWNSGKKYIQSLQLYPKKVRYGEYPTKQDILSVLFKEKNLLKYNEKFKLREKINELYSELSKYVHDRPDQSYKKEYFTKSSLFNMKFSKEDFFKWFDYLKRIYLYISTVLILLYPKLLNAEESSRFRLYFPEEFNQIENFLK